MDTIKAFWAGLTPTMKTIIIVIVGILLAMILGSFIFAGTDYSGFGDWLKGWMQ